MFDIKCLRQNNTFSQVERPQNSFIGILTVYSLITVLINEVVIYMSLWNSGASYGVQNTSRSTFMPRTCPTHRREASGLARRPPISKYLPLLVIQFYHTLYMQKLLETLWSLCQCWMAYIITAFSMNLLAQ